MNDKSLCSVDYFGQDIFVSQEVAEFLREDELYMQAQKKKEQRHLDMRDLEEISEEEYFHKDKNVEKQAIENYFISQVVELSQAILSVEIHSLKEILVWYYCDGLSMEAIGSRLGISKVAVSKRHKKILKRIREELHLTNGQVRFLFLWIWWLTNIVLVSYIVGGKN